MLKFVGFAKVLLVVNNNNRNYYKLPENTSQKET